MKCDVTACDNEATKPIFDPIACVEHWDEFLEWQREKQYTL